MALRSYPMHRKFKVWRERIRMRWIMWSFERQMRREAKKPRMPEIIVEDEANPWCMVPCSRCGSDECPGPASCIAEMGYE